MVQELSTDPYVPLIGTLPPHASQEEAQACIDRQLGRLAEGSASRSPGQLANLRRLGLDGNQLTALVHRGHW